MARRHAPGFPLGGIGLLSPGTKGKELLYYFLGKSEEDRNGTRKKGSAFEQNQIKLDIFFLLWEIKAGAGFFDRFLFVSVPHFSFAAREKQEIE